MSKAGSEAVVRETLAARREYFDQRSDIADWPTGSQPSPNEEMTLLQAVDAAISALQQDAETTQAGEGR